MNYKMLQGIKEEDVTWHNGKACCLHLGGCRFKLRKHPLSIFMDVRLHHVDPPRTLHKQEPRGTVVPFLIGIED